MMVNRNRYSSRYSKRKPEGATYMTSISLILATFVGMCSGLILPWISAFGDGSAELTMGFMDLYLKSQFFSTDYFLMILFVMMTGMVMLTVKFLNDIDVLSESKLLWSNLIMENMIVFFSLYLVFIASYFLGYSMAFNKVTLLSDDMTAVMYTPAFFVFVGVGIFAMVVCLRAMKREADALLYKKKMEDIKSTPKKKVRKYNEKRVPKKKVKRPKKRVF